MNDAIPSWKSAVAMTALLIAAMAAIAAGLVFVEREPSVGDGVLQRERRALQQLAGQLDRPLPLSAGLDHLLHEPDAQRFVGA